MMSISAATVGFGGTGVGDAVGVRVTVIVGVRVIVGAGEGVHVGGRSWGAL
jgi:hypothetical protein